MSYQSVALITGSNTGIGYQVVRQLAEKGYKVYLAARSEVKGKEAVASLKKDFNVDVRFVQLDLSDSKSIESAKKVIEAQEGKLDVLVNNAALSYMDTEQRASSPESLEVIRLAFEVNFFRTIELTQTLIPLIRKAAPGYGNILNVTTEMGSNALMAGPNGGVFPQTVAYNLPKVALNSYTIALARELKPERIRVNCVTPGFTTTQLNLFHPGGQTTSKAAENIVAHVVYGPDDDVTGKFFGRDGSELPW